MTLKLHSSVTLQSLNILHNHLKLIKVELHEDERIKIKLFKARVIFNYEAEIKDKSEHEHTSK
ncbi:CLUMA_CG020793, isoform A [Clunio marinus]|uniref:CLUMA_CG020793, isoform A n=1 Tax=Clunio marinus TaxID=568069 RepID=A0A1J1J618_9DIPT|nr:CLUMA_CG020793, isoform A [Clunio marinus]